MNATLYCNDINHPDTIQQRVIISLLKLQLSLQQIKQQDNNSNSVVFVNGNFILTDPNAISMYLIKHSPMLGRTAIEQIKTYQWLQYYNISIYPLLKQIYGQISKKQQKNTKRYQYARQQLIKILVILNKKLKISTYFIGNTLTFIDICMTVHFYLVFAFVIRQQEKSSFCHVVRWFNHVRNLQGVRQCLGDIVFCKDAIQLEFQVQNSGNFSKNNEDSSDKLTETSKKQQLPNTQKQLNKQQQNQQQLTTNQKQPLNSQQIQHKLQNTNQSNQYHNKQSSKINQKQQQIIQQSSPSQIQSVNQQQKIIKLENNVNKCQETTKQPQKIQQYPQQFMKSFANFKQSFQKNQQTTQQINQLLNNFPSNWSICKITYNVDVPQKKDKQNAIKSCTSTFNNLKQLKNELLGIWSVFYSQQLQQYSISGVIIYKDSSPQNNWKQLPSYQYYTIQHLNPKDINHQQIIHNYWEKKQILFSEFLLIQSIKFI